MTIKDNIINKIFGDPYKWDMYTVHSTEFINFVDNVLDEELKRCNITQGVNDLVFYTCDKCEEKIR